MKVRVKEKSGFPAIRNDAIGTDIAIVVDVLRACTTISILLLNGATSIMSVDRNLKTFLELRRKHQDAVFVGERNKVKMVGAHLSNSPSECMKNKKIYRNKKVVFSSTNFSPVLEAIQSYAIPHTLLGCIVNSRFVAKKAFDLAIEWKKDISLIKCGELEDEQDVADSIGCALIAKNLAEFGCALDKDVQGKVDRVQGMDILALISISPPASILEELGLVEDVQLSCKLDTVDITPKLFNGIIKKD